ncbi:MAG TPA: hypothetical protein VK391_06600 [Allosphingosinicella sp.]|jgi:hypothetical protein|nr:hypothetical protein [Allosphingosinicella sp.]
MFERTMRRATALASQRAERRAAELAERLKGAAGRGILVDTVQGGVRLSGRGLRRRLALEPALRWLTAALR